MIHSSKQLKDLIRNLSKEVGIEAHVLIRKYMMERFLERVSSSFPFLLCVLLIVLRYNLRQSFSLL